jgi:hypothetical protein
VKRELEGQEKDANDFRRRNLKRMNIMAKKNIGN